MFERYTEKARRTIFFARYEASQYGSQTIEVTHLLLGLLRESGGTFDTLGIGRPILRQKVEALCVKAPERISTTTDLPLNDACKRALGYAAEEAKSLAHKHIGPEHLLMGVLREGGPVADALGSVGIHLGEVRLAFGTPGVSLGPGRSANMESLANLLAVVPDDRLVAAAQILAGLSAEFFAVAGVSPDGPFSYSFGNAPDKGADT